MCKELSAVTLNTSEISQQLLLDFVMQIGQEVKMTAGAPLVMHSVLEVEHSLGLL
jgi:hypothetical protein